MLAIQILINSSVIAMQVLLLAAALYLLYTVTGIFCVHLGALMMVGSYSYYALAFTLGWSPVLAFIGALLIGMLSSVLIYYLMRVLVDKQQAFLGLIASIGILFSLEAILGMIFGAGSLSLVEGTLDIIHFGDHKITAVGLWTLIVGTLIIALAGFVIYATSAGRKLRAVHQHKEASESLKLNVRKVQLVTFAVAGLIVSIIGILATMNDAATPQYGTEQIMLAFIAFLVGGVRSFKGMAVTTLVLVLGTEFITGIPFGSISFSTTWIHGFIFIFALIVLLIRPEGLISLSTRKS